MTLDHYTSRITGSIQHIECLALLAQFQFSWLEPTREEALGMPGLPRDIVADMRVSEDTPPEPPAHLQYSLPFVLRVLPRTHVHTAIHSAERERPRFPSISQTGPTDIRMCLLPPWAVRRHSAGIEPRPSSL